MPAIKKKKLIIVLGMHRSGTSAVTRSLPVLGVNLGDALHPAAIDNPKGFWENQECLAINEELLRHFGSAYDCLDIIKQGSANDFFVNELKHRAIQYINYQLEKHSGLWGFKDPRTCRLLFFWQEVSRVVECEVCYVIVLRNPLSVAASLAKRNQIAEEKSHLLWLLHILPAVLDSAGAKRVVVDYDIFMDSPFEQLVRLSSILGLKTPDSEGALFKEFENSFLEESLRHTKFTENDLITDSRVPRETIATYQILIGLARDEKKMDDPSVLATFHHLFNRLEENSQFFRYSNKLEQRLSEHANQNSSLQAQVKELLKGNAWMTSQRDAWQTNASELNVQISSLQAQVKELLKGNAWMTSQRDAWLTNASELNVQISSLQAQVKELRAWKILAADQKDKIVELNEANLVLNALLLEKEQGIRDAEIKTAEILASRSWRFTEPLRTFWRCFRGVKKVLYYK